MNIPIDLGLPGEIRIDLGEEICRDARGYDGVNKLVETKRREYLMSVQRKCS